MVYFPNIQVYKLYFTIIVAAFNKMKRKKHIHIYIKLKLGFNQFTYFSYKSIFEIYPHLMKITVAINILETKKLFIFKGQFLF